MEGDIKACFDEISHVGVQDRLRARVADKRILLLVKAFLKAGILSREGVERHPITGTPQGGILSPLLSNLALSVLDEHFAAAWESFATDWARRSRRSKGLANYRLVRYADDWVVLVAGDRAHAEALRDQAAAVLATMGLRLSLEKTRIAHIDEGFDFLGRHIQRHTKRGTKRQHVYTYPSKDALASIKDKVRAGTQRTSTNQSLADLCDRLNPALRGWTTHFRHDVSKANFSYLQRLPLEAHGPLASQEAPPCQLETAPTALPARMVADGGREDPVQPQLGTGHPLPIPGRQDPLAMGQTDGDGRRKPRLNELVESRMRGDSHVRFGRAGRGNSRPRGRRRAPARLSRLAGDAHRQDDDHADAADRLAHGRADHQARLR